MAELPLLLGALSSIVVVSMLFYLSVRHRDFYLSDEGKKLLEEQMVRFKAAVVLGIPAFLILVGIEVLEAMKVVQLLPRSLEDAVGGLKLAQLALMLLAQLLVLSVAVKARSGGEIGTE